MEHDVVVLSPEKTILTYRLAGLGARIGAHLIDILVIVAVSIGVMIGIGSLASRLDVQLAQGLVLFVVFFAWPILYFVLLEGLWNGQTLGKKMLSIRVRMVDGTPVRFGAALGRNLLRPADMLPGPYLVGILATFANPRSQRIGDLVASTIVIYEKRAEPRFAVAPHTVGIHPLESHVGELRGMTQEEYNALRRFADRFPELSTNVQNRLLAEVWEPIAQRRSIPALPDVHPVYLMEATVMKYGRQHGML